MHSKAQPDWRHLVAALMMWLPFCSAVLGADIAARTTAEKTATGVHMAVRTDDQHRTLLATQLANAATGYNWVAKATPVGPMVGHRGEKPWIGATQGGVLELAECVASEGMNGIDSLHARWRNADGLELRWSVQNCAGVLEFQSELNNGRREDAEGLTRWSVPLQSTYRLDRKTCRSTP